MRSTSDERSFKEVVLDNTYSGRHFQINSGITSTSQQEEGMRRFEGYEFKVSITLSYPTQ
jgi:hypothetical protein